MKKIQDWLQSATIASWSFGLALLVTMFVASGCKTTKTTTKTEIHTELETDSTTVAVQYDSTGVDMNRQLTANDKLKTSGQVEIEEEIETTSIAATDSTPAMTTTNTKRRIKCIQDEIREIDTTASQTMHKTEVSSDSLAVYSHSEEKNQQKSEEKTTEKCGPHASKWDMRLFCVIVILVIGYVIFTSKGKR